MKKVILIILDSVGVGQLPDAHQYGDVGSNTLSNTARAVGGLKLPHLGRMGLGNIIAIDGVPPVSKALGAFGKMAEKSAGKDTTTGHWEICGVILDKPFPVYPEGFPPEVIEPFTAQIGRPVLGNKAASGTQIIQELGEEHIRTGYPIVYTSADSVFQIAAHEDVIPVEELYRYCRIARKILTGEHAVGRVIARPFTGKPGYFQRTTRRHDFSLEPPGDTLLDIIAGAGLPVVAVGKIKDIFAGRGITHSVYTKDNMDGVDQILAMMDRFNKGLIFANLVDYDMRYGHRNDYLGYAKALEEFDKRLPEIVKKVADDHTLIIAADHGCDPTTDSTDHSREYVPVLIYGPRIRSHVDLGTRETFADLGATIADMLEVGPLANGTSMAPLIV